MAPPSGSQTSHPKARAWWSGWSRQVGDLAGLPPLREADVCESTGHKNAQPTRPERNAQTADLHRPSKDCPRQIEMSVFLPFRNVTVGWGRAAGGRGAPA